MKLNFLNHPTFLHVRDHLCFSHDWRLKKGKKKGFSHREEKKIHCGTFVNVIFVYCSVFIETDRRRYWYWFNSALVLLSAVLYWIAQLLLLLLYLSPVHRGYTLRLQGTQTPFIMVTTATDCRVGENLCVCVGGGALFNHTHSQIKAWLSFKCLNCFLNIHFVHTKKTRFLSLHLSSF